MSGKKDDKEKFHEIDDERFDDQDNRYFQYREDEDDADISDLFANQEDSFYDYSDMITGIFDTFIRLLPVDIQEYADTVLNAILSSGSGKPDASNMFLKEAKKLAKGKDVPGISFLEAQNYKLLAINSTDPEEMHKNIVKQKKALDAYIKYCDKDEELEDFESYINLRCERAKIKEALGDMKGAFIAMFELPAGTQFDIDKVMDALDRYYESNDDAGVVDEHSYSFLSEGDNAIRIDFFDPSFFSNVPQNILDNLELDPADSDFMSTPTIVITIDASKDLVSACFDLQQILTALCKAYPEPERIIVNSMPINLKNIESMVADTDSGYICEPVIFQVSYEIVGDKKVVMTHIGPFFGKKDVGIAIPVSEEPDIDSIAAVLTAMSQNIKHTVKPGAHLEFGGKVFKTFDFKARDRDIILIAEKKND